MTRELRATVRSYSCRDPKTRDPLHSTQLKAQAVTSLFMPGHKNLDDSRRQEPLTLEWERA